MPGKTPAADAAQPAEPQEAAAVPVETQPPDTPPAGEAQPAAAWGNWRYTGPPGRIYTNVPVTPEPGDVITWPDCPSTDGDWQPTPDAVTRQPDNHRPDPAEED